MKNERIPLRCSSNKLEKIRAYAAAKNRTVNNLILYIVKNKIKSQEKENMEYSDEKK